MNDLLGKRSGALTALLPLDAHGLFERVVGEVGEMPEMQTVSESERLREEVGKRECVRLECDAVEEVKEPRGREFLFVVLHGGAAEIERIKYNFERGVQLAGQVEEGRSKGR